MKSHKFTFGQFLGISTVLVFMLSLSTLGMEASKTSTISAGILFSDNSPIVHIAAAPKLANPRVKGASVEIALAPLMQKTDDGGGGAGSGNSSSPTCDPATLPSTGYLKVIEPSNGLIRLIGSKTNIGWTHTSDITKVNVGYKKGLNGSTHWAFQNMVSQAPNPCSEYAIDWTIPSDTPVGTDYYITITGFDSNGQQLTSTTADTAFSIVNYPNVTDFQPRTAAPGETITVTGTGFTTTNNKVLWGSWGQTLIEISSVPSNGTELTFTVPSTVSEGSYNFKITNENGEGNLPTITVAGDPVVNSNWQITVYDPFANEQLPLGSTTHVAWYTSPNPDTNDHIGVYLALMKPGDPEFDPGAAGVLLGAGDLPYAGNYNWTVGQYVATNGNVMAPVGSEYRIAAVLYNFTTHAVVSRDTTDAFSIVEGLEGLPDLIVENISINPSAAGLGDSYTVIATIKNIGNADAFVVGATPPLIPGGNLIVKRDGQELFLSGGGSDERIALAPGATTLYKFGGGNVADLYTFNHAGSYTFTVNADINNSMLESNEDNNSKTYTYVVSDHACASPGQRADEHGGTCCAGLLLEFGRCYESGSYDLAVMSTEATSSGFKFEFCNKGDAVQRFPVNITVDSQLREFNLSSPHAANSCQTHTWSYGVFGITDLDYTHNYNVQVSVDPNGTYHDIDLSNNTMGTSTLIPNDAHNNNPANLANKLNICHFNNGSKKFNKLIVSKNAWLEGHSNHENDYILEEDDLCRSASDEPNHDTDNNDDSQTTPPLHRLDPKDAIIAELRARIKNLQIKLDNFEKQVIDREKNLVKRINQELTNDLKGRILLDVEGNGEAWYVDANTGQRFYLRNGASAYEALQVFGHGITNSNLNKIPVGIKDEFVADDSDGDGLPDKLEEGIGTNPNNPDTDGDGFSDGDEVKNGYSPLGLEKKQYDQALIDQLRGEILIQVENRGQAWYLNPEDGKRYYLKDGQQAYEIMKHLSLGISKINIHQIDVGNLEQLASE